MQWVNEWTQNIKKRNVWRALRTLHSTIWTRHLLFVFFLLNLSNQLEYVKGLSKHVTCALSEQIVAATCSLCRDKSVASSTQVPFGCFSSTHTNKSTIAINTTIETLSKIGTPWLFFRSNRRPLGTTPSRTGMMTRPRYPFPSFPTLRSVPARRTTTTTMGRRRTDTGVVPSWPWSSRWCWGCPCTRVVRIMTAVLVFVDTRVTWLMVPRRPRRDHARVTRLLRSSMPAPLRRMPWRCR